MELPGATKVSHGCFWSKKNWQRLPPVFCQLPPEDVKEFLEHVAVPRVNRGWEFMLSTDAEFIKKHPDIAHRQHMLWLGIQNKWVALSTDESRCCQSWKCCLMLHRFPLRLEKVFNFSKEDFRPKNPPPPGVYELCFAQPAVDTPTVKHLSEWSWRLRVVFQSLFMSAGRSVWRWRTSALKESSRPYRRTWTTGGQEAASRSNGNPSATEKMNRWTPPPPCPTAPSMGTPGPPRPPSPTVTSGTRRPRSCTTLWSRLSRSILYWRWMSSRGCWASTWPPCRWDEASSPPSRTTCSRTPYCSASANR